MRKIKILSEDGELLISLGQLYAALRRGARFEKHYMIFEEELIEEEVPEVDFCPSDEDVRNIIINSNDPLSNICSEVYRYYHDKCAACAIKAFSILLNDWIIDEKKLLKIFEVAKSQDLKLEWKNGSIVLTKCVNSWIEALSIIRKAIIKLQ